MYEVNACVGGLGEVCAGVDSDVVVGLGAKADCGVCGSGCSAVVADSYEFVCGTGYVGRDGDGVCGFLLSRGTSSDAIYW